MGDIETMSEEQTTQIKLNGEVNGNHLEREEEEEEEKMEIDGLKKAVKDSSDLNEPRVLSTNGKESVNTSLNSSKDAMEVDDDNGSVNGDQQQTSKTEEVTIHDGAEHEDDGVSIDTEKDALALPDDVKQSERKKMASTTQSEAVVLSDSSDDDSDSEDDSSATSKFRSAERSAAVSESEGISNGAMSTNLSRMEYEEEDDKPVSIHSDSDEKEDDCIMIDDESKKTAGKTLPRVQGKSEDTPAITDFDDDIEEIVEDPLDVDNPAKRIKLSGTTITSVDLSRPSSSSSASSYPVNLSTNSRSSSGSSQALNLTTSKNSLLNPFASSGNQSTSSGSTLLPNLTDDMFVLEAPSFIVPYIYEKPPTTSLRSIVNEIGKTIIPDKRDKDRRQYDDEFSNAGSEANNQKSAESSDAEERKRKNKNKSRRRGATNGDESWDEYNTSTDEDASDGERRTKVLIKESHADIESIKTHIISSDTVSQSLIGDNKNDSYFESPLGKFFMTIGVNLVQEYVQSDLLRQQKKKREKEGKAPSASTQMAINSLQKSLEVSKENNAPFKHKQKRCEFCSFKTESAMVLSQHYEIPHQRNNVYKCNYCEYEARPVHDILYHMEAIHNMKGRLDKPFSYHLCPNCPFEDNGKSKIIRHEAACVKKFKPENNLSSPVDWEPPAKIPRIKAKHGLVGAATAYQAMAAQQQQRAAQASALSANISSLQRNNAALSAAANMKSRSRIQQLPKTQANANNSLRNANQFKNFNQSMLSNNYQLAAATLAAANTQFLQQVVAQKLAMLNPAAAAASSSFLSSLTNAASPSSSKSKNSGSTPSISITPLPRQQQQAGIKPGQSPNSSGGKPQFVICEICDGYIKDLDQLRNHMQWIHKVKIHPKMIYNRPPLNCQKCQYRFFTDQGLERHLLGSHGLVTSSMQEAANNGKDAGRCPVCGKVFQWKLLNHVSRDHNMTLKPAHLSYKCTVCTATFGMYKLFENHVYSAHSTVAKKDNKAKASTSTSAGTGSSRGDSLLKPLKINDEITIIPQPAKRITDMESHIID